MKKQPAKFALAAALGLAITLTFTACGKGGDVKLLETITDENGNVRFKFEYDKQNRIVKIDDKTITYADNLITVGTQKFAINGNTVTIDGESFTINEDGYIVKNRYGCAYEYKDGNLIKIFCEGNDRASHSYDDYDDKKSPFSNSNTPKWLIQYLVGDNSASKNNVLDDSWEGEIPGDCSGKYVYDKDEFPVTNTRECAADGEESTLITYYTYRGEPQKNIPAKTETAASEAESQPSDEEWVAYCGGPSPKKGSPITIEAVFWEIQENIVYYNEPCYLFSSVTNGEKIQICGKADDLKKGDKVSITYQVETCRVETEDEIYEDTNRMISFEKIGEAATTFTDTRDGKTYITVKIGEQVWMAENLNYKTSSGSWCYGNDNSNCGKYGRLYDLGTAEAACPAGYRLPFRKEWNVFLVSAGLKKKGDCYGEGSTWTGAKKLKAKSGWEWYDSEVKKMRSENGTDDYGFSALPGGSRSEYGADSEWNEDVGASGSWWTLDEVDEDGSEGETSSLKITGDEANLCMSMSRGHSSAGYSVRCIKK